jgi:hypothetical protein
MRASNFSRSVNQLLAFASTVIPGFSLLYILDQDLCSLLDMYMFRNRASSLTRSLYVGATFVAVVVVLSMQFRHGPHRKHRPNNFLTVAC